MDENLSTIHNIGDKVWLMYNNRPLECIITGIKIVFSKGSYHYGSHFFKRNVLLKIAHHGIEFNYDESSYGILFFSTKKELIESLYKD